MTRVSPSMIKQSLLLAALRLYEERGWNQPDRLIFLRRDDEALEIAFLDKPLPETADPVDFLLALTKMARTNPKIAEGFGKAMPTMYGLGLLTEGEVTPEVEIDDWADRRKPADWEGHPSLRLCRLITVIDLYGQVFNVEHILGELPTVHQQGDLSDHEIVGTPVEALRQLFIEMLKAMTPDQERLQAIERLQEMLVPDVEDVLAAARLRKSYPGRSRTAPGATILPLPEHKEDDR